MDLLNPTQRAAIRSALQDVFDTFHKTEVTYKRQTSSADDFMETLTPTYSSVKIDAQVEYDGNTMAADTDGALDAMEAKVTFGFDNLYAKGLIDAFTLQPLFKPEIDFMDISGKSYKVISVNTEGNFQARAEMVVVKVRKLANFS
jgi:hypothetical protein